MVFVFFFLIINLIIFEFVPDTGFLYVMFLSTISGSFSKENFILLLPISRRISKLGLPELALEA